MRPSLPYPTSGRSFLQFGHRYKINQTAISTAASTVFVITTGITRNESDGKKRITVLTTKSTRISPKPPLKIARITRNVTRRIILSPFVSKTSNLLCLWYQGSNASSIKQRSNGCKNEMQKKHHKNALYALIVCVRYTWHVPKAQETPEGQEIFSLFLSINHIPLSEMFSAHFPLRQGSLPDQKDAAFQAGIAA